MPLALSLPRHFSLWFFHPPANSIKDVFAIFSLINIMCIYFEYINRYTLMYHHVIECCFILNSKSCNYMMLYISKYVFVYLKWTRLVLLFFTKLSRFSLWLFPNYIFQEESRTLVNKLLVALFSLPSFIMNELDNYHFQVTEGKGLVVRFGHCFLC